MIGLENEILAEPRKGDEIRGSGDFRKIRLSREGSNKGKSGSYRVLFSTCRLMRPYALSSCSARATRRTSARRTRMPWRSVPSGSRHGRKRGMRNGFAKSQNGEDAGQGQETPGGRGSVSAHRRGLRRDRRTPGNRRGRRVAGGHLHDPDRKLELKPREYGPKEVRAVRMKLRASQALLARFMGVNTQTVSSWEQGRRKVPPMARRYLDDLWTFRHCGPPGREAPSSRRALRLPFAPATWSGSSERWGSIGDDCPVRRRVSIMMLWRGSSMSGELTPDMRSRRTRSRAAELGRQPAEGQPS